MLNYGMKYMKEASPKNVAPLEVAVNETAIKLFETGSKSPTIAGTSLKVVLLKILAGPLIGNEEIVCTMGRLTAKTDLTLIVVIVPAVIEKLPKTRLPKREYRPLDSVTPVQFIKAEATGLNVAAFTKGPRSVKFPELKAAILNPAPKLELKYDDEETSPGVTMLEPLTVPKKVPAEPPETMPLAVRLSHWMSDCTIISSE